MIKGGTSRERYKSKEPHRYLIELGPYKYAFQGVSSELLTQHLFSDLTVTIAIHPPVSTTTLKPVGLTT